MQKEPIHGPEDSITNISILIKTHDSRKSPQDTEISRVGSSALFIDGLAIKSLLINALSTGWLTRDQLARAAW